MKAELEHFEGDIVAQKIAKEQRFYTKYNINRSDISVLIKQWFVYGNHGHKFTPAGHYFIQEIIEHYCVDFKGWKKKLHPDLIEFMQKNYPQLMTTDKNLKYISDDGL